MILIVGLGFHNFLDEMFESRACFVEVIKEQRDFENC